jgi:hypothetical protein
VATYPHDRLLYEENGGPVVNAVPPLRRMDCCAQDKPQTACPNPIIRMKRSLHTDRNSPAENKKSPKTLCFQA